MQYEYGERRLYNQLLYYAGLWDVDKEKEKMRLGGKEVDEAMRERVVVLAENNRATFGVMRGVVEGYLRKCGRQWVDMGGLFGFAMK